MAKKLNINTDGYRKGSPNQNNPYNLIPSNRISMNGVDRKLMLIPIGADGEHGNPIIANPGEEHFFPDYTHVLEIPHEDTPQGKNLPNIKSVQKQYIKGKPEPEEVGKVPAYSLRSVANKGTYEFGGSKNKPATVDNNYIDNQKMLQVTRKMGGIGGDYQFSSGGWLDKYQTGGEPKPKPAVNPLLDTSNWEQSSLDSLKLYNAYQFQEGGYIPVGYYPSYQNPDGSYSNEVSMGLNVDDQEMLLPSFWDGKRHTDQETEARYRKTGEHLGKFNTVEESERAAQLREFMNNEVHPYSKRNGGWLDKYQQGGQNNWLDKYK